MFLSLPFSLFFSFFFFNISCKTVWQRNKVASFNKANATSSGITEKVLVVVVLLRVLNVSMLALFSHCLSYSCAGVPLIISSVGGLAAPAVKRLNKVL